LRFGSHVYGTNVAESDTDFRSVHIPDARDILLQRAEPFVDLGTKQDPSKPNSPQDVDHISYALQRYLELLLDGQADALTMLFAPDRSLVESSHEWEQLRQRKSYWLSTKISGIKRFCIGKLNKYAIFGGRIEVVEAAVDFLAKLIDAHGAQKTLDDVWADIELFVDGQGSTYMQVVEVNSQKLLDVCDKKAQSQSSLRTAHGTFKGLHESYLRRAAQLDLCSFWGRLDGSMRS
jgi:hypothetical protein